MREKGFRIFGFVSGSSRLDCGFKDRPKFIDPQINYGGNEFDPAYETHLSFIEVLSSKHVLNYYYLKKKRKKREAKIPYIEMHRESFRIESPR